MIGAVVRAVPRIRKVERHCGMDTTHSKVRDANFARSESS